MRPATIQGALLLVGFAIAGQACSPNFYFTDAIQHEIPAVDSAVGDKLDIPVTWIPCCSAGFADGVTWSSAGDRVIVAGQALQSLRYSVWSADVADRTVKTHLTMTGSIYGVACYPGNPNCQVGTNPGSILRATPTWDTTTVATSSWRFMGSPDGQFVLYPDGVGSAVVEMATKVKRKIVIPLYLAAAMSPGATEVASLPGTPGLVSRFEVATGKTKSWIAPPRLGWGVNRIQRVAYVGAVMYVLVESDSAGIVRYDEYATDLGTEIMIGKRPKGSLLSTDLPTISWRPEQHRLVLRRRSECTVDVPDTYCTGVQHELEVLENGTTRRVARMNTQQVSTVSLSPDGRFVAYGFWAGSGMAIYLKKLP